jgi:hypothetical protein
MNSQNEATTVESFVARAKWRASLVRGAQTLSVALCAAASVALALELDGAALRDAHAWIAAALCATLAGSTWWYEQRLDAAEFARRLDRRLELGGALFTTLEARSRGAHAFAGLLEARTARALRPSELPRAAPPPALGWLAAPAIAVGVWLAAAELRPVADPELVALAREVRAALDGSREASRDEAIAGSEALRSEAEAAAVRLARAAGRPRFDEGELARALEQLDRRLAELESGAEAPNAENTVLREQVRAAARRLGLSSNTPAGAPPGASTGGADLGSPLQSGPGERTMTGSTDDARPRELPADERSAPRADSVPGPILAPAPAERGEAALLVGRWWPPEHDAVVAAWREAVERPERE